MNASIHFREDCVMDKSNLGKVPIISLAAYNTLLLHAEKINNGQHDFAPVLQRELRDKLSIDDTELLINELITTADSKFLNQMQLFLSQFPFIVEGAEGARYQLVKQGNFCELDLIEQSTEFDINENFAQNEDTQTEIDSRFGQKHKSYGVYTEDEYNALNADAPIKFNHLNIVIKSNDVVAIDGFFDCKRLDTAYLRFCKIMNSIDSTLYPKLAGWDFIPAKKINCVTDEHGIKIWLNEKDEFLFSDSSNNQPADDCLVVDRGEDQYYFFGYFHLYSTPQKNSTAPESSVNGKLEMDSQFKPSNLPVRTHIDNLLSDNESNALSIEDSQDELAASMEIATEIKQIDSLLTNVKEMTLDTRAERIRQLQADVQHGIIEIGFELIAAKKQVGHGSWAQWLQKEFEWSQRTANRFMAIAERFGNSKLDNAVQFKASTLQAMLALPEGDEHAFIEAQAALGKPIENQSAREVQVAIKKWKKDKTKKISPLQDNEISLFADDAKIIDQTPSDSSVTKDAEVEYENQNIHSDLNSSKLKNVLPFSKDDQQTESPNNEKNLQSETLTIDFSEKQSDNDDLITKRAETKKLLNEIATLIQTATNTELTYTIQTLNSICNVLSEKFFDDRR